MENIFALTKNYAQDAQQIMDWFPVIVNDLKSSKLGLARNESLLRLIRQTPGLIDTVDFMNDIYDKLELSAAYIALCCIKPSMVTAPMLARARGANYDPTKDKQFDETVPSRKCRLHIPVTVQNNLQVQWIDPTENITDENRFKVPFKSVGSEVVPNLAYLIAPGPYRYINTENSEHIYYVEVGFENNPDFETIKGKFNSL
jgi:hypothetical protein